MRTVTLERIADIQAGGTPLRSNEEYWKNGDVPWIKISDFNGKYLNSYTETITKKGLKNSSAKIFEKGTILFTIFATLGEVTVLGFPASTNQAIAGINIFDDQVNADYLFYYLLSIKGEIKEKGRGVAQNNINLGILKNLQIPLPPLPIQKKIVEVLDKAQQLIDLREKQLSLMDDLIQSVFYTMFGDPVTNLKGWEVKTLSGITSKIGSGATPRGGKESYKKHGISLIRSLNVHNDRFQLKDLAFIDDEQARKLSNVIVEEKDVLLNITGASVARCCIVPIAILPARVNQHVSILRSINNVINPVYLSRVLTSRNYQKLLLRIGGAGGATREAITKEQIENLELAIPPIDLQNQFAEKVKAIESQKELMQQSLEKMKDNYNSLMQRAFRGELF